MRETEREAESRVQGKEVKQDGIIRMDTSDRTEEKQKGKPREQKQQHNHKTESRLVREG